MHHRFRSFLWNLHENLGAVWTVADIGEATINSWRFDLREAFAVAREEPTALRDGLLVLDDKDFTVEAKTLDHRTPSMAYLVREKTRWNIDPQRLAELGLKPGPWLKDFKDPALLPNETEIAGYRAGDLRERLLVETPGESIAYLTDFLCDTGTANELTAWLTGCRRLVCESQYRAADLELAQRHHHLTSVQAAALARDAGVEELILFHVSGRYTRDERAKLLEEARGIFPATRFPDGWREG